MKDNSELTRQQFGNALWQAFAAEGKTEKECSHYSDRYDALTDTGMSPENAFTIIYQSQGSCDAKAMLNQAARFIHSNLDSMTKFAPKIKTNSSSRFSDLVKRFNSNLDKCGGISVNGVSLDADEIKKLHLPVPASETFTASASDKSGNVKSLSLEVTR